MHPNFSLFKWKVPWISSLVFIMLLVVTVIFYFIPFRTILLLMGFKFFVVRFFRPDTSNTNKIMELLSRVHSDKELVSLVFKNWCHFFVDSIKSKIQLLYNACIWIFFVHSISTKNCLANPIHTTKNINKNQRHDHYMMHTESAKLESGESSEFLAVTTFIQSTEFLF